MTNDEPTPNQPSSTAPGRSGFRTVLAVGLRVLFAIVLGIVLGIGVYWGGSAVYRELVGPMRLNSERIDQVFLDLAEFRSNTGGAQATEAARMADMREQLAQQVKGLETLQAQIGALETARPTFEAGAEAANGLLTDMAALEAQATQAAGRLDSLQAALSTPDPALVDLDRQVQVLRLMSLVSQAQLAVAQADYGQAGQLLTTAQAMTTSLAVTDTTDSQELSDVLTRLDLAQQELKRNPSIAAGDLDIAWQLLVELSAGR